MGFLQQNRNAIIRDGWSRVEITAGNIDKTLIFLSAQLATENQVPNSVERRQENMGHIIFLLPLWSESGPLKVNVSGCRPAVVMNPYKHYHGLTS